MKEITIALNHMVQRRANNVFVQLSEYTIITLCLTFATLFSEISTFFQSKLMHGEWLSNHNKVFEFGQIFTKVY